MNFVIPVLRGNSNRGEETLSDATASCSFVNALLVLCK